MHRLLRRQLKKHLGIEDEVPAELQPLLAAVDAAYTDFDSDRAMLERSLELSSKELSDAHDEAKKARERLIDAIESTSEGFAFYDAEDRLELCNMRYRELLHPGGEMAIEPGMSFEDIVRGAVARDLIEGAASDPEAWIQQRLARHRDCGEPQLQHRKDGRWVQVSERRITGGGTVAVFSDLTELKDSEQRAAAANRLILDSIRYASRIQSAILPARDALARAAREHFLIWEPRDVVGGDFFWFHPMHGGHVVIVGDCTVHGVPGAFMTLIACGLLDRILQTVPPDEPSRILGELHRGLQVLLGQKEGQGETDDGLEAGVCFVSEPQRRLVFAGARFSLWRADDGAVDEIKGDKAGIGYRRFAHDMVFTDVPLELSNGSAFYMTTDGLIDQVGGPRRLSFGKKRFSEFVAAQRGRPMPEQGAALTQLLAAYQGNEARRDDVTVLGFT
jgi:serine phosphatase RsbU (regulator of sigma subunit)/PAS domain-containing protein